MGHRFSIGERVEAHCYPTGHWIEAVIERLEPYRGRPGYYVRYPKATQEWERHCGWQPENCLRQAPVVSP